MFTGLIRQGNHILRRLEAEQNHPAGREHYPDAGRVSVIEGRDWEQRVLTRIAEQNDQDAMAQYRATLKAHERDIEKSVGDELGRWITWYRRVVDLLVELQREHEASTGGRVGAGVSADGPIAAASVVGHLSAERSKTKYDVALSFAGEDRVLAERLASLLIARGHRVFYDDFEKATLWGKDLYQHLANVYQHQARYCVMFLSEHAREKRWTRHEQRAAQARAFEESREYILPLRLDDTEVPGLLSTTGYIDMRLTTVDEVADLLSSKISELDS